MANRRGSSKSGFRKLKAEAEGEVARWEWASGPLHDLRPYFAERLRVPRGKPLPKAPAKKDGAYEYGFDDAGRLVVARRHTNIAGQVYEELFRHEGDRIDAAYFDAGNKDVVVNSVYHLEGGRPVSYERTGPGWTSRETYHYDGDRLVRIETFASNQNPQTRVYELSWDGDGGSLRSIAERARNGVLYTVYEAPRATDRPVKELEDALEDLLVDRVPNAIGAARIGEPAYCVALVYDEEGSVLPPELGVGLERERARWVKDHGKGAASYLWSPEDYEHFDRGSLSLDDPEVREASRALLRRLEEKGSTEPAVTLLARVAAKLNAMDWSSRLPVTKDFIVCPVRLEGGVREKDLTIAVPAARRTALKRKGYL